jgi:hypothetical protein
MAKKRKTRQEKVISDLHRQLAVQATPQIATPIHPYSLRQVGQPVHASTSPKPETHAYVLSDLRKTLLLTAIAIASQFVLYVVLTRLH